ncbi:MAG: hypothetical protein ACO31I_19545 [Prochlorotrichaceae cyanobacterium]
MTDNPENASNVGSQERSAAVAIALSALYGRLQPLRKSCPQLSAEPNFNGVSSCSCHYVLYWGKAV